MVAVQKSEARRVSWLALRMTYSPVRCDSNAVPVRPRLIRSPTNFITKSLSISRAWISLDVFPEPTGTKTFVLSKLCFVRSKLAVCMELFRVNLPEAAHFTLIEPDNFGARLRPNRASSNMSPRCSATGFSSVISQFFSPSRILSYALSWTLTLRSSPASLIYWGSTLVYLSTRVRLNVAACKLKPRRSCPRRSALSKFAPR